MADYDTSKWGTAPPAAYRPPAGWSTARPPESAPAPNPYDTAAKTTASQFATLGRLGRAGERGFEKWVARPATAGVAGTLGSLNPAAMLHPETPPPQWAQTVAQNVVPQTIPQAVGDITTLALPEIGIPGRVALNMLTRGAAGAATGFNPVQEALAGAGQTLVPEIGGKIAGKVAGKVTTWGERMLGRESMEGMGGTLNKMFKWLKPLKTSEDLNDNFGLGQAIDDAKANLNNVRQKIVQDPQLKQHTFNMDIPHPGVEIDAQGNVVYYTTDASGNVVRTADPNVGKPRKLPHLRGTRTTVSQNFATADDTLTELNKGSYNRYGKPKEGVDPAFARELGRQNKNRMVYKLNQLRPGMGSEYAEGRRGSDFAHVMGDVFQAPDLFDQGLIRQEPMIRQLKRYSPDLQRALGGGPEGRQALKEILTGLRHGDPEEVLDILSRAGQAHLGLQPNPHMPVHVRYQPGSDFVPAGSQYPLWMKGGKLVSPIKKGAEIYESGALEGPKGQQRFGQLPPMYITPPGGPITTPPGTPYSFGSGETSPEPSAAPSPGASNAGFHFPGLEGTAYGAELPPDEAKPKAMPEIHALQNRELAPTPGGAARAGEISARLRPGGKPTDVTQDLERGRLSSDEVKKLLQRGSSMDPAAQVAGIPLADLMGAAETGTHEEKQVLAPLIEARMRQELPKLGNKTMQAKLAQRFQRLQRDARPKTPHAPLAYEQSYAAQPPAEGQI